MIINLVKLSIPLAYKTLYLRRANGKLEYLNNKTVAEALPPMFKKIKRDVFKFNI